MARSLMSVVRVFFKSADENADTAIGVFWADAAPVFCAVTTISSKSLVPEESAAAACSVSNNKTPMSTRRNRVIADLWLDNTFLASWSIVPTPHSCIIVVYQLQLRRSGPPTCSYFRFEHSERSLERLQGRKLIDEHRVKHLSLQFA